MHILSVHNAYQIRGGEDESREAEEQLLKQHGHTVDVYEEHNNRIGEMPKLQAAMRTIWSMESYQKIKAKLQQDKADLVHVQNFFPLISPAAHYAATSEGIPVIQSLRNYRLLCPNGFFFREGRVCELCIHKSIPIPALQHRCYRDDRAATGVLTTMLITHRLLQTWKKQVTLFVTLSEFSRQKYIEGGFPANKIVVKPNFVYPDPQVSTSTGSYALYVGRLSPEKGIATLLSAWTKLRPHLPLKIVGEGPLESLVQQAACNTNNITWLGRQPIQQVYEIMGNAKMLIFPTAGYETFGRVIVEAFAKGTPVISTNIGSGAELVTPYKTGLLFQPGNSQDLINQVDWMRSHPVRVKAMRKAARAEYESHYTAARNYQQLQEIYSLARAMK